MKTITVRRLRIGEGIPKIICPIMGESAEEIITSAKRVYKSGADAAEFRADSWPEACESEKLSALLNKLREILMDTPLLFTFRTKEEGGMSKISKEMYSKINLAAMKSGAADMIDFQLGRRTEMLMNEAKNKNIKVVLSYHDFSDTPNRDEIVRILSLMQEKGADIAKIACMPQSHEDVAELLEASKEAGRILLIPHIAISMGNMGVSSRMIGGGFASDMTFASAGVISAPGQSDVRELLTNLLALHEKKTHGGHVFLTGFMGTGKSSVAYELGRMTGKKVYELDDMIADRAGRSITGIFKKSGEEAFRNMETDALRTLITEEPGFVSCGGGIVMRTENEMLMKSMGTVILLTASPETVFRRLRSETDKRPVLRNNYSSDKISVLMNRRLQAYRQASDIAVRTDDRTVNEIAEEIRLTVEKRSEVL